MTPPDQLGAAEKAAMLLHAADIAEEREAVMRNTWSDIEFHGGEMSNAELVERLERQFAASAAPAVRSLRAEKSS
ncbi:mcfL [Symbiodinium natans]|uniref:McfL protein n=1 Tax=Symbiodinium natans TaxID=878477 RepID=A0A812I7K4_9DINO|nr:mcfL [Symbiodinium natans]